MKGSRNKRIAELEAMYPRWVEATVWDRFTQAARRWPDRDFMVFEDGRRYTYRESLEAAKRLANALVALGVRPGDHVAVMMGTRPESVLLALAVQGLRAVRVAVNDALGPYELGLVLDRSEARFLIADKDVAVDGAWDLPKLETAVLADGAVCSLGIRTCSWDAFADLAREGRAVRLDAGSAEEARQSMDEARPHSAWAHEVSDIIFTSGSTGAPKGVPLEHDMLLRSAFSNCLNRGFEAGRRVFVPLPLFHVYAYVEGVLAVMFTGGAVLLAQGKLDPERALAFMRLERANDVLIVPSLMIKYVRAAVPLGLRFPDLHAVYCSASANSEWLLRKIHETFGVHDVITGYGMTEVCGATIQPVPLSRDLSNGLGRVMPAWCAGSPAYDGRLVEYKVVDPTSGKRVLRGQVGELWCRGLTVMRGYCNDPEANARAFAEGGWFKTGDLGRFNASGCLELAGRAKDSYKINGENVSTEFVEQVVARCGNVLQVKVVGVPDQAHGEVGAMFVELGRDTPQERARLEDHCKQSLAKFQVPKYVFYMRPSDWTFTASGKIDARALREAARQSLAKPKGRSLMRTVA